MAEARDTQAGLTPLISVVIPVLNEEDSLRELHGELCQVASAHELNLEIIFVDDGSTDASWDIIAELSDSDPRVGGVRFRRNFGKAVALAAGFRHAEGDIVVTMDADLQDDPWEMPKLLAALQGGLDAVTGWKQLRQDPWHKVWPSRVFNWMVSAMTGVCLHDHNCGFKAYRSDVVRELTLYGELHRFIPVLARARGFKIGEEPVHHRARRHGQSKYGARRFARGFLDLLTVRFLTGYAQRPLHLLGGVGLVAFLLGFLGLGYLAVLWCLGHRPIGTRPMLMYSLISFLLGTQMVAMGFLAELLIARHQRDADQYSIAGKTPPRRRSLAAYDWKAALGEGGPDPEPRPPDPAPDAPPAQQSAASGPAVSFGAIAACITMALTFGMLLRTGPVHCPNDQSRWNTVWSLIERGDYQIDEAPWAGTIDKVRREDGHYYSSKPPLLPTILAGEYWLIKKTLDMNLQDHTAIVVRIIMVTLNVLPLGLFVWCFSSFLDRYVQDNWWRIYWLLAASVGTFVTAYSVTLNNHSVAAIAAMLALYYTINIGTGESRRPLDFLLAGGFAAWTACNEVPGLLFGGAILGYLIWQSPRKALMWAVPPAIILGAAYFYTLYKATGDFIPVYLKFNSSLYQYEGSYWSNPTGIDALDEPKHIYLFHMILGHHGIFALSPIFLMSAAGMWCGLRNEGSRLRLLHGFGAALSLLVIAVYTLRTNNYGGVCNGLRWTFWLIPLWLMSGALGSAHYGRSPWVRRLAVVFLLLSVFSMTYALHNPWTRSWLEDFYLWTGIIDYYG